MSFMLKNQVFCDVVLCKLLNGCWHFGEAYCLLQAAQQVLLDCLALKMEALYLCEILVTTCQLTWLNIPEDLNNQKL
jgi:hypothetical protein